jgi:hypothetical protein
MQLKCKKTKSRTTPNGRVITYYTEGKYYVLQDEQVTNVKYVIADDGYKQVFNLTEYREFFEEV